MTVLLDHDVLDGAPMVRFLNSLNTSIENGAGLSVAADERE
jgi:pyruvate/2-oxoglutarate dehydrogenase complex dihydrolipoamide acyltransferase (E2) component